MYLSLTTRAVGAVVLVICSFATAHAASGTLRAMTTDRPRLTGSPFTVDPGHVQVEWGVLSQTVEKFEPWDTRTRSATGFSLKIGLAKIVDLEVLADPRMSVRWEGDFLTYTYYDSTYTMTTRHYTQERIVSGPTVLRMKINTSGETDDAPVATAFVPFSVLDSGSGSPVSHPFGLEIPVSMRPGDRWRLSGMTRGTFISTAFSTELDFFAAAGLSAFVTPGLETFFEFGGERFVTSPGPWTTAINMGTAWRPFHNLQVDGAVGFGALESTSDWTLTFGLSGKL